MKICHVTSAHKTNDVRIFQKECTSLAKMPNAEVCLIGQGEDRIENNVRVIGAGEIPCNRIKRMVFFTSRVVKEAKKQNADIYHLHDPELLRHALRLKRKGAAVIFDSHENILDSIDEKTYMPKPIRSAAKYYYSLLQKRVYPKLDAIIVVSPQMIEPHEKLNDNVVLITNFPIVSGEEDYHEDPGSIVFAGGVSRQWSHKEILKAIEGCEDIHYYVYGSADRGYLEALLQTERKNFTYGGILSFSEVQTKLQEAEMAIALLKPGKNTFFGEGTLGNTKLFEAMLNKKPIIATGFRMWKEIIEKNECGICVDPDDPSAIRQAILMIHDMTVSERKKMGENGRKAVEEHYNWNKEAIKLQRLYQQLWRNK